MNNWEDLKNAVGQWSVANFGSQKGLGCLVPLMGLVEEYGEFFVAETIADEDDAIGDMCIFLMDYCYRSGVSLSDMPLEGRERSHWDCLAAAIGSLFHCQVKRVQRIRGMDDQQAFCNARLRSVGAILHELNLLSPKVFKLACDVWSEVVSKRKWHEVPDKPMTLDSVKEDFGVIAGELNRLS